MGFLLLLRVASLGRMILPVSPGLRSTLGAVGRMLLHLSPTCLPLWVSHTCLPLWVLWAACFYICLPLVSHSGCPHSSPTLGALGRMLLHLSPTCLPHLFPTLGALVLVECSFCVCVSPLRQRGGGRTERKNRHKVVLLDMPNASCQTTMLARTNFGAVSERSKRREIQIEQS